MATLVRDLRADLDLDSSRFERGMKSAEASAKVFEKALREQERAAREAERAAEQAARKQAQALKEQQDAIKKHRAELEKSAKSVGILAGGLVGLGTATPVVAGVGAAAATMGGAFVAAGAGIKAFAAAAGPTLERVQEAVESQDYSKLSAAEHDLARSWEDFSKAYLDWQRSVQPALIPAITGGLGLMERTLPRLSPLVEGTARSFVTLEGNAERALNGPFWTSFIDQVGRQAPVAVTGLGNSLINVGTGVAGVVNAFLPFTGTVVGGVEKATAAFATWGQQLGSSSEFHQFVAFVQANMPLVIELAGNLARAVGNIAQAVVPLGVSSLGGLNLLAELVAGMDPAHIRAIAAAILAIKIGSGIAAGVTALQNLRDRLREVGDAAGTGGKAGVAGKLAGLVGVLGGPWGIAIAAGVTALGLFAQKSAEAEQFVKDLTEAIRSDSGAIGENTRARVINKLETEGLLKIAQNLGLNLRQVTDAALGNKDALAQVNAQLQQHETLAQSSAGRLGTYSTGVKHLSGDALTLRDALTDTNGSLRESVSSYQRTAEAAGSAGTATATMGGQAATAAGQIEVLTAKMGALYQPTINAFNAETELARSFDAAKDAIEKANGQLDISKAKTAEQKQAILDARDSFTGYLSTVSEAAKANGELARASGDARTAEFERQKTVLESLPGLLQLAGKNKEAREQVLLLAQSYGISRQDALKAAEGAKGLKEALDRIKSKSIRIDLDTARAEATWAAFTGKLNAFTVKIPTSIAAPKANGGITFAGGGIVSFAGGSERHIAQIARPGEMRVWAEPETQGEAYIPLARSKRDRSEAILAEVAARFGMVALPAGEIAAGGFLEALGAAGFASGGMSPAAPGSPSSVMGSVSTALTKSSSTISMTLQRSSDVLRTALATGTTTLTSAVDATWTRASAGLVTTSTNLSAAWDRAAASNRESLVKVAGAETEASGKLVIATGDLGTTVTKAAGDVRNTLVEVANTIVKAAAAKAAAPGSPGGSSKPLAPGSPASKALMPQPVLTSKNTYSGASAGTVTPGSGAWGSSGVTVNTGAVTVRTDADIPRVASEIAFQVMGRG